jgi:hypothetical protein
MYVTTTAHGCCYLSNVDSFSGGQGAGWVRCGEGEGNSTPIFDIQCALHQSRI